MHTLAVEYGHGYARRVIPQCFIIDHVQTTRCAHSGGSHGEQHRSMRSQEDSISEVACTELNNRSDLMATALPYEVNLLGNKDTIRPPHTTSPCRKR